MGEAAVWDLDPAETPTGGATSFKALVTRLDCNSGVTGEVLPPTIDRRADAIVVTFTVAPKNAEAARCQGNNQVPYEVDLGEPIGKRSLADGQCLQGGRAAKTAFCFDGPTRFKGDR